jgi:hypothetical protein
LNIYFEYFQVKNDGNVYKVHQDIHEGRQATVKDVLNIADFSEDTCQHIVTEDFNMSWITAKFMLVC